MDKIREIAVNIRKKAEDYAVNNDFPQDLEGVCAIASEMLFRELKKSKFSPVIHVAIDSPDKPEDFWLFHAFVVIDNYIIDITASQFIANSKCYPNVLIQNKTILEKKDWQWKTFFKFNSLNEFKKWKIENKIH